MAYELIVKTYCCSLWYKEIFQSLVEAKAAGEIFRTALISEDRIPIITIKETNNVLY